MAETFVSWNKKDICPRRTTAAYDELSSKRLRVQSFFSNHRHETAHIQPFAVLDISDVFTRFHTCSNREGNSDDKVIDSQL